MPVAQGRGWVGRGADAVGDGVGEWPGSEQERPGLRTPTAAATRTPFAGPPCPPHRPPAPFPPLDATRPQRSRPAPPTAEHQLRSNPRPPRYCTVFLPHSTRHYSNRTHTRPPPAYSVPPLESRPSAPAPAPAAHTEPTHRRASASPPVIPHPPPRLRPRPRSRPSPSPSVFPAARRVHAAYTAAAAAHHGLSALRTGHHRPAAPRRPGPARAVPLAGPAEAAAAARPRERHPYLRLGRPRAAPQHGPGRGLPAPVVPL
ncbi:hypothetical protein CALCODRAFT_275328 [Calocera cornea HHB12733]|uniref:Uncharacterized protein n=1 Tax=Calocera cornea HHB12733 TaxID=1353952 RepID=A0A165G296_9BASI|nr:hypothetical protein CALCODRAFT_275328 [Calocera cornea HHB12733]